MLPASSGSCYAEGARVVGAEFGEASEFRCKNQVRRLESNFLPLSRPLRAWPEPSPERRGGERNAVPNLTFTHIDWPIL